MSGWLVRAIIRSDAGACEVVALPTGSPRTRIASTNQSIKKSNQSSINQSEYE
jgi:hypothetical protein